MQTGSPSVCVKGLDEKYSFIFNENLVRLLQICT
jgi:hypothetical protein